MLRMRAVGIATWLGCSLIAWLVARFVASGKPAAPALEISVALVAGFLAGLAATAFDFGGWREIEWRAALLSFLVALAAIALLRIIRLSARVR